MMGMKLVMHFVSGDSFFVGIWCLVVGTTFRLFCQRRIRHTLLRLLAVIGITFVLGSATPLPVWLYLLWFALAVGIHVVLDQQMVTPMIRHILVWGVVCLSSVLFLREYAYRHDPEIPMSNHDTVYVIGDSVSSGLDEGETPWPQVLAESMHIRLVNLVRSGATVETAFQQATRIPEDHAIVFVEIGGNDVFGGTDAPTFQHHLTRLLDALDEDGHRMLMFELPLLPFYNRFGQVQRTLAAHYEVCLIPKTVMARIFGILDGTTDGIHLSQKGHDAMAECLREFMAVQPSTE